MPSESGCHTGSIFSIFENGTGKDLPESTGDTVAQEIKIFDINIDKNKKPSNLINRKAFLMLGGGLVFTSALAVSFHKFTGVCLFLSVKDCGGFFKILPLFEFTNDAFFFHHTFKTFDGFFKQFIVVNGNVRHN
jgi:hypothetical protein